MEKWVNAKLIHQIIDEKDLQTIEWQSSCVGREACLYDVIGMLMDQTREIKFKDWLIDFK